MILKTGQIGFYSPICMCDSWYKPNTLLIKDQQIRHSYTKNVRALRVEPWTSKETLTNLTNLSEP